MLGIVTDGAVDLLPAWEKEFSAGRNDSFDSRYQQTLRHLYFCSSCSEGFEGNV